MRVDRVRRAVRGPARVRDAGRAVSGCSRAAVRVRAPCPWRAAGLQAVVGQQRDAGRVVAAVFQASRPPIRVRTTSRRAAAPTIPHMDDSGFAAARPRFYRTARRGRADPGKSRATGARNGHVGAEAPYLGLRGRVQPGSVSWRARPTVSSPGGASFVMPNRRRSSRRHRSRPVPRATSWSR